MHYATAQDLVNRYGKFLLMQLTGLEEEADCTQGECDTPALMQAAADTTAEINTYLAGRYVLPLPVVPAALTRLAVDIMIYRLSATADTSTEEQRKRYEDALKVLKSFATGEISLGLPTAQTPTSSNGVVFVAGPRRKFGRGRQV